MLFRSADAILDRIIHNAHKLVLNGPSRRKGNGEATGTDQNNQRRFAPFMMLRSGRSR